MLATNIFAQDIVFNKKEQVGYNSYSRTVFAEDLRYVTLGVKIDSTSGKNCLLFCSFDLNGTLQYKKIYCDAINDYYINSSQSASSTSDGGFIYTSSISDTVTSNISDGADFLLVKYNSTGDTLFTKRYNWGYFDPGYAGVETSDGGFLLCGTSNTSGASTCGRLIKTDSSGNVEWSQTYNCNYWSYLTKIIKTDDGGYCMAGEIQQTNQFSYYQMQIIKVDNNGNQQWIKYFGGPKDEYSPSISKLTDGNILVSGMYTTQQDHPTAQYSNILYILKLNANTGDTIWTKKYGESGNLIQPYFNYENTNGSLIIGGMTYGWIDQTIFDSREMGFLMKLTLDGENLWFKKYYIDTINVAFAEFCSGKTTFDGGAIICGRATDYGGLGSNTWLLKTDANGCIDLGCVNGIEELEEDDFSLFVYPNPAEEYVSIDLPIMYNKGTVQIYNMQGQLVSQKQITQPNQQIPISELGNGMYIFVIQNGDKVIGRQRVMLER